MLAVTSAFYDAASGAVPWDAVTDLLRPLVHARTSTLLLRELAASAVEILSDASVPNTPQAVAAYIERNHSLDIWTIEGLRLAVRDEVPRFGCLPDRGGWRGRAGLLDPRAGAAEGLSALPRALVAR